MKFNNQERFFDLLNLYGGGSCEDAVRHYIKEYIQQYPSFTLIIDRIGSVFAYKASKAKNARTITIAAHMDEVCFMVTNINKDGSLKVINVGGITPQILYGTSLVVITKDGQEIPAVIGASSSHLGTDHKVSIKEFDVDVATSSDKETKELGIAVGDFVYFKANAHMSANNEFILSKAIDNRIGCGIILSLIAQLANIDLPFNIYLGCHSQEEVGLRGAKTASSLIDTDLFFAVDTSPISDVNNQNSTCKLGSGLLMRTYDRGNQLNTAFRTFLEDKLNEYNLPYQSYFANGGTDAIAYLTAKDGTLATSIVLPARYIHSQIGVASVKDITNVISFYYQFLTKSTNDEITKLLSKIQRTT